MAEDKEMSFLDHIGELRGHLIRSCLAIIVGAFLIGFNIDWVMDYVILGPTRQDFITYEWINHFSRMMTDEDSVVLPERFPLQVRRLFEQFNVMMSVSIVGGLVVAFPYIVWEIWRFIKPALLEKERKVAAYIINSAWFLFVLGVLCGYYVLMPFIIQFGFFYKISDVIKVTIDLSDYIGILLRTVVGMGIVFLFPIVVYILTQLGILTPKFLRIYRRHAIIVIMIIAAIITPSDVFSMFAAGLPLILLYELSIWISVLVYRRLEKE